MFWEIFNSKSKIATLAIAALLIGIIFFSLRRDPGNTSSALGYGTNTVKARVVSIIEEGFIPYDGVKQPYQVVEVVIQEGSHKDEKFTIDYGKKHTISAAEMLAKDKVILVSITEIPDSEVYVDFADFVRTGSLAILVLIFVLICVLVSGWKGIRSILGVGFSVLIIIYFIIPQILAGRNPIFISLIGSLVFITITQYLVYGWTLKTHIALGAITISILITGLISVLFVNLTRLNGLSDESSLFLLQQYDQINMKNLLIAGIIIGALGILDDLVLGQTSTVIEMYRANQDMTFSERYRRSMNVGKDHIAATVNTLVLAYLGASLSLFLVFSNGNIRLDNLINMSYMAEEIVRSLVGTIGLFMAVPITTYIACWIVDDPDRLSKLVRLFGPLLNYSEVQSYNH